MRGNLGQILVESHSVSHEVPVEPMPPLSKTFYDHIADIMGNVCFQSQFSVTPNDFKNSYDMDMIRQSAIGVCSAKVSFQNPPKHLQPYQEFFEDLDNINIVPNHEVEFVEFEHQEIGHVYYDPIVVYMEELLFSKFPSIPKVSRIVHSIRTLCCEDQDVKKFIMPMQVLFMI